MAKICKKLTTVIALINAFVWCKNDQSGFQKHFLFNSRAVVRFTYHNPYDYLVNSFTIFIC